MFYAFPFWERCVSCAASAWHLCCCCLCPCTSPPASFTCPWSKPRHYLEDEEVEEAHRISWESCEAYVMQLHNAWLSILAHTLVHISSFMHMFIPQNHSSIHNWHRSHLHYPWYMYTSSHVHTTCFMQYIHHCGHADNTSDHTHTWTW